MISFGDRIPRICDWATWKSLQSSKFLVTQHDDDGSMYTVYGYDGPEVVLCYVWKGELVGNRGITQEQNDANKADFETNYKPTSNRPIEARTADGRAEVRHTTAKRTTNFNLRVLSFYTARSGSMHNINPVNDTDFGDALMCNYDVSGSLVTDPEMSGSMVKTVIDWEPHYNYEVIGGYVHTPSSLMNGTTDQWYLGVIGVPDLPVQMYGSVPYISETNIEAVTTRVVESDGCAVSFLPYKFYGYPTNKLRFIFKHPPGAQQRFQIYVRHFV